MNKKIKQAYNKYAGKRDNTLRNTLLVALGIVLSIVMFTAFFETDVNIKQRVTVEQTGTMQVPVYSFKYTE